MEWILSLMDLFGRLARRVPVFSWIVFVAPSAGLTTTLLGGRREHRDRRSTACVRACKISGIRSSCGYCKFLDRIRIGKTTEVAMERVK